MSNMAGWSFCRRCRPAGSNVWQIIIVVDVIVIVIIIITIIIDIIIIIISSSSIVISIMTAPKASVA